MRRLILAALALALLRADMFPDASNAKQPEASQNLGLNPSITDFGAKCDGSTDDKDAFTAATDWMSRQNGRTVRIPAGICVTSQTVEIGNGRERSTTLSSAAALGAVSLQVTTATGIQSGDGIVVQLDSGQYRGTVNGTPSGTTVQITPALTGAAAVNLRLYTAAASSTYHGAGYVGAGSCSNVAGASISTIKYSGPAAPTTTLAAPAAPGALSIQVASIAGFDGNGLGVPVGITLDTGAVWWSWTSETPANNTIQMMDEIPSPAAAGNEVFIANTAVIRVNGPIMGPQVEGLCLDADGKAAIGMDARQIMSGKFRGTRGITAKNYSGIGFWLHTDRSAASSSGGYSDTDHELFSETPTSDHSIGTWMAAGTDHQENIYTRLGWSRNRTHGGNFRMGGASPYAAALRIQHIDNNTFDKTYAFTGSSPGLGAGLYRQPSWQRAGFPQENYFISPVFPNGVINGTATATGAYLGVDYMTGYSTSDGAPLPKWQIAGSSNTGEMFGMLRPSLLTSTEFSSGTNLLRSINVAGRHAYVVEGVSGGNTVLDVVDVANPEAPALISQTVIGPGNPIGRAAIGGGYLYIPVSDNTNSIYVVDISNISAPILAATIGTANLGAGAVALSGNLLVAATRGGGVFRTYDVSNPIQPRQLATISLPSAVRTTSIALKGRYAYLAQVGSTGKGLEIVDLANPAAPISAGSYNAGADVYGLAVAGRYAYLAKAGNILDVVNISNPAAPSLAGTATMKSISTNFAGPLAIIGDYLFWPGSTSATSVQMVDIKNPAQPIFLDQILNASSAAIDFAFVGANLVTIQSGTGTNFRVHRLYGHSLPAGQIGALTTDILRVRDGGAAVDGEITAGRGITAGLQGIATKGPLSGNALSLSNAAIGAKLSIACGTTPGTAKLVATAGTGTTPTTILDNIGAGVSGC